MENWSDNWYFTGLIGIVAGVFLSIVGIAFVIAWAFNYQWWAILVGLITASIIAVCVVAFTVAKVFGCKSGHYF